MFVTNVDWQHRAHFFAISATMMRRILLDRARKRGARKRGGNLPRINLEDIADIRKTAEIAINNDLQLCIHAIGDRANREVLNLYESVFKEHPDKKNLRWRVEHAQIFFTRRVRGRVAAVGRVGKPRRGAEYMRMGVARAGWQCAAAGVCILRPVGLVHCTCGQRTKTRH